MGKDSGKHGVTCAVCGKRGSVDVKKDGKISGDEWNFFGRFSVNFENGEMLYKNDVEGGKSAGFPNPVEYWECDSCFKDVEQIKKMR